MNSAVAVSEDGDRLVVFSYANNAQGAAFLVTLDAATLAPIHASDTRGHLLYGCGARLGLSFRGDSGTTCDTITAHGTTNFGFDPDFNGPVRFRGEDLMDSSPAIDPAGAVSIGSYDGGFQGGGDYDARGGGVLFSSDGSFLTKNEQYWWEVTASVLRRSDGSFSYLADHDLFVPENDISVARYDQTQVVQALSQHPDEGGQAFQDAHIPFGPGGDHYAVSSDGTLRKFAASGKMLEELALPGADGEPRAMFALSEYFARDRFGRIYVSHAGSVYVVESSPRAPPRPRTSVAATIRGVAARAASLASTTAPSAP